jgi:hypothetical protein
MDRNYHDNVFNCFKIYYTKDTEKFLIFIESDFQEYESDNPVTHFAAVQTIYIDELVSLV